MKVCLINKLINIILNYKEKEIIVVCTNKDKSVNELILNTRYIALTTQNYKYYSMNVGNGWRYYNKKYFKVFK